MSNKSNNMDLFGKYYLQLKKKDKSDKEDLTSSVRSVSSNLNSEINMDVSQNFKKIFDKSVIPFLSLKDLIELKKSSKLLNSLFDSKSLQICILSNSTKNFSSKEQRKSVWEYYMKLPSFILNLLNNYLLQKENTINENDSKENEEKYYKYILEIISKIKNNDFSSIDNKQIYNDEKIKSIKTSIDFISRDINRTFYNDYFKKEGGQQKLQNVLEAMCAVPGNVGYCQGMNFIIGAMLYLIKDETKVFYLFSCMIQNYELTSLFAYNTPDYGVRVYQINYYVKKYMPQIYHHFVNNNIPFDMIYSRWLLTLFANYIDIEKLDFPWSCFFINKWKGLIKMCLVFIYELKSILLKCDLEKLGKLLLDSETIKKYHNNYMNSFYLYNKLFKVTNSELNSLRRDYFVDLAKTKLKETKPEEWDEDQKVPLNDYLTEKNKLEIETNKQIQIYKKNNELALKKYLNAFKKYNVVIKNIDKIKQNIDVLATKKNDFEKLFIHYKNALDNIDKPQSPIRKNNITEEIKLSKKEVKRQQKELKTKKDMLVKGKNKIMENYMPIKNEYDDKAKLLYKKCDDIFKHKLEVDKCEKEKNKQKEEMKNYLFEIEEKHNELIQVLSEKLKLSEVYKKTYKF